MADNIIKVNVTANKTQRVTVSSANVGTEITASSDTGKFWAQTSKNWAVSENIVDGEDYSSKYYANKSKGYAQNAESFEAATRETYDNLVTKSESTITEIEELKEISEQEISIAVADGLTEINQKKNTAISDLEFVSEGEKEEIKDLANLIKENAQDIANRTSFAMFDTILKDHVLTYEESKGLALQGTWVYKTAIAGSRYGYPDFYAKCLEEYNEATDTETVNGKTVKVHSNGHKFYDIADKTGIDEFFSTMGSAWFYGVDTENKRIFLPRRNILNLTPETKINVYGDGNSLMLTGSISGGTATGRLLSHYAGGGLSHTFYLGNKNDLQSGTTGTLSYNVPAAGSTAYAGVGVATAEASDGKSVGLIADLENISTNQEYLYICVGNTVADTSWVDIVTQVNGGVKEIEEAKDEAIDAMKNVVGGTVPLGFIGSTILGIDETLNLQRYLNGQIILQDQFKGFTKFLKRRIELYPSVACTEDEWQTTVTMSSFSQCGKFVIDDNAGTIRLPKVVNIQGLTDLSKLGEIVEAGLPNITGYTDSMLTGSGSGISTGALHRTITGIGGNDGGKYARNMSDITFDASRSSSVYKDSVNTVQQEQIQYPYFIQVATGAETEDNIINEIELNNPFSLLDYKYSEYELNNLSWLRSNGQYNSKAVYPAVYDLLLKIYNGTETKAGVSVKLSTETFTDYDFVLNTAEETFRLPIKVKLASGKAVVGNGNTLGLTNGDYTYGISVYQIEGIHFGSNLNGAGQLVSSSGASSAGSSIAAGSIIGLSTDPTKSGIETSDSDLYLYFYVGEVAQNTNLVNAGRIEEKLHSLIPDNSSLISGYPMPSDKYIDFTVGASGAKYTAPANGWFAIKTQVTNSTGSYVSFVQHSCGGRIQCSSYGYASSGAFMPCLKGQYITLNYESTVSVQQIRFIYAEGDK